jgi:hypothetical protein
MCNCCCVQSVHMEDGDAEEASETAPEEQKVSLCFDFRMWQPILGLLFMQASVLPLLPIFGHLESRNCDVCKRKDKQHCSHHHLQVVYSPEEATARRQHYIACPPSSQPIPELDDSNVRDWIHNRCSAVYTVNKHCCSPTCYKYWKRIRSRYPHAARLCRFGYPQDLVCESHFTEDLCVEIWRMSHDQNAYSPCLMAALGVNHDIRHLWGNGESVLAAVFYATAYATKLNLTLLKKFPILRTRVEKYIEKSKAGFYKDKPAKFEARSFISSVLLALQGEVEVSLMTVVNHLLQQPECLHPDRFERLVVWPLLEWAEESDQERGYHDWEEEQGPRRGETFSISSNGSLRGPRLDYHFRPEALDSVCYYDWVQLAEKLRRDRPHPVNKNDDFMRFEFTKEHPEWHTHCVRLREWPDRLIPEYNGPSIPSRKPFLCHMLLIPCGFRRRKPPGEIRQGCTGTLQAFADEQTSTSRRPDLGGSPSRFRTLGEPACAALHRQSRGYCSLS